MGMWKSQLEEESFLFCTGIAKLKITETGEVFTVSSDSLSWESSCSGSEQGMGYEFHHSATVSFDSKKGSYRVRATWNIWEYPVGVIDDTSFEVEGGEPLQDFDDYFLPNVPNEDYEGYYSSAILSNTRFYETFLESVEKIQALLYVEMPSYVQLSLNQDGLPNSQNADLRRYFLRLLYSNIIASLETYLSDAFINTVLSDMALVRNFIESTPEFATRKLSLKELFTRVEQIRDEVKEYLSEKMVWHRLEKVKSMYKDTLEVDFPENCVELFKAINLRHDIVHRNGRSKSGKVIELDEESIKSLIETAQNFVDFINKQISSTRNTYGG